MSKISYSAVVLDEKSRQRLINKFKKIIPKDYEIIAHHMTINMGEIDPEYEKYLGMSVRLSADEIAMDDKVIAVGVSNFPSKNKKPHITLAVNRENGGKPVLSNNLEDWKEMKRPINLVGTVKEVPLKI